MRGRLPLVILLSLTLAKTAFAQAGVVEPPAPRPRSDAAKTLATTGFVLTGLGALTMMASGIVWLNAASHSARLDDECPNETCVEGTSGADSLESARDSERAADILLGISLPVLTAGFVLVIYTGGLNKRTVAIRAAPAVSARRAGGKIEVSF
jgi:hypothetical protein